MAPVPGKVLHGSSSGIAPRIPESTFCLFADAHAVPNPDSPDGLPPCILRHFGVA